jgi:hypothetical protein
MSVKQPVYTRPERGLYSYVHFDTETLTLKFENLRLNEILRLLNHRKA